jgi:hypothetical protein
MDRFTRDGSLSSTIAQLGLRGVMSSPRSGKRVARLEPPADVLIDEAPVKELFVGQKDAVDMCEGLQYSLDSTMTEFVNYVIAVENSAPAVAESLDYFTVTFEQGALGMILVVSDDGAARVSEMRYNAMNGEPLLAKSCGKISIGDAVVSIHGFALARDGPPTLAQIAAAFQTAPRPVTVLFKRGAQGRGQLPSTPSSSASVV